MTPSNAEYGRDKVLIDSRFDGAHPRGFGAFPRVLGKYVREQKVIPLEVAISGVKIAHPHFRGKAQALGMGYAAICCDVSGTFQLLAQAFGNRQRPAQ